MTGLRAGPKGADMRTIVEGRLPENRCFQCGELIDGFTGLDADFPEDGDVSICVNCCAVLIFQGKTQRFVKPSKEFERKALSNPALKRAIETMKQFRLDNSTMFPPRSHKPGNDR